MKKIKCIAADDEPHALRLIKSYIERIPYLDLVEVCSNAEDVLVLLEDIHVDLLYLDIQMPGLSGMDLAKIIEGSSKIIFTTAFDEFAIEGYKVNALDYLLKPFSFDEFLTATNKIRTIVKDSEEVSSMSFAKGFIMIKADYKIWQIDLDDILFFEGVKDYSKIYRKSTSKILMPLMSIKNLEDKLSNKGFMRVHRSYIVNLNNIEVIERSQIVFDQHRITISDKYKEEFNAFLESRYG